MKNMRQTVLLGLTAAAVFALASGNAQAQSVVRTWSGGTSSDWATGSNWSGGSIGPTDGTYNVRLNVQGTRTLNYTSAQGTTIYNATDSEGGTQTYGRSLCIYSGASMAIQSGTFTTGGDGIDLIGITGTAISTLTIDGGTYHANTGLSVGYGTAGHGVFNINSGEATISTIHMVTGTAPANSNKNGTLNLNGGTLSVNNIFDVGGSGTTTVLLNGGTLKARQSNTAFISANLDNLRVGTGGAKIDTAGFDVTIAKALTPDGASTGGLIKSGAGILTLSGTNTYTGDTHITAGTLALTGGSLANSATITVDTGATLDAGSIFLGSGQTLTGGGLIVGTLSMEAGSTLAPGASAGTLTFEGGDLTLSGSHVEIELNGTTPGTQYDRVVSTGAEGEIGLMLFNSPTLSLSLGYAPAVNDSFTIFSGFGGGLMGGLLGTFDGLDDGAIITASYLSTNYDLQIHYGTDSITLSVIPEPATLSLLGLAGLALMRRRKVRG